MGFAPVAGTFWAPVPPNCDGPSASLIHIHGETDRTVPLGGRPIRAAHQGDVPTALSMWKDLGGFEAAGTYEAGNLVCDSQKNAAGQMLDFCLHPGGHSFATQHVRHAWERLNS